MEEMGVFDEFASECLPADDPICQASVWIYRFVPTILLAIGTVGNSINIFVFSRKKLRQSPCFLLVFLSIFDILFLWSFYLQISFRQMFDTSIATPPELLCNIHAWFLQWSASLSFMTIAIFTVERVLFIVFPHNTKFHLNRNKSIVLTTVIAVLCGAVLGILIALGQTDPIKTEIETIGGNLTQKGQMETTVVDNETQIHAVNSSVAAFQQKPRNCSLEQAAVTGFLQKSNYTADNSTPKYRKFLALCYTFGSDGQFGPLKGPVWTFLFLTALTGPFLIIISGNITLIVHMCKRRQTGASLDSQTKLLFLITGLLFGTIGSMTIFVITVQGLTTAGVVNASSPVVKLLFSFVNSLGMCNISLNCALYAWKGTLFQQECRSIIKEIRSRVCK